MSKLLHPPKALPGDKVAILSPSFAAPAVAPAVHEQALRRLKQLTGFVPAPNRFLATVTTPIF